MKLMKTMNNQFPLISEMAEFFFGQDLNDEVDTPMIIDIALEQFFDYTSPDFPELRAEVDAYLRLHETDIETAFRDQYPQSFDPTLYGFSVKSFMEKIVHSIDALPDDYFPSIHNMMTAGLHQDIDCYGDTLEEWLDAYWQRFIKVDFIKLKNEIINYVRYYGPKIDDAFHSKYKNDFNPVGLPGCENISDFFAQIVGLIDERVKRFDEDRV